MALLGSAFTRPSFTTEISFFSPCPRELMGSPSQVSAPAQGTGADPSVERMGQVGGIKISRTIFPCGQITGSSHPLPPPVPDRNPSDYFCETRTEIQFAALFCPPQPTLPGLHGTNGPSKTSTRTEKLPRCLCNYMAVPEQ
jgi:hypothetical protein